jgi:hypothetical protein
VWTAPEPNQSDRANHRLVSYPEDLSMACGDLLEID